MFELLERFILPTGTYECDGTDGNRIGSTLRMSKVFISTYEYIPLYLIDPFISSYVTEFLERLALHPVNIVCHLSSSHAMGMLVSIFI
jgi:hypothetical protein